MTFRKVKIPDFSGMKIKSLVMKGVLLVNLGSPDSPTAKDVKPYLDEFLMDERVIDVSKVLRNILVRGIILQTRPKKSAEAYAKIWWEEGSPLVVISERFSEKVRKHTKMPVALGMRYGSMSIKKGLQELNDKGVDEVLLVPLYPRVLPKRLAFLSRWPLRWACWRPYRSGCCSHCLLCARAGSTLRWSRWGWEFRWMRWCSRTRI